MAKNKKWEIKGLKKNSNLCTFARIILKTRFDYLFESIETYFNVLDAESLHNIRIALRRVRYNMELFIDCFNRNKFFTIYKKIQQLQDLSGLVRDLDVYKLNTEKLKNEEKIRINKSVIAGVENKRKSLEDNLKLELMKLLHNKSVKNFYKSL
jgi:CHAD domain-containing protein